MKGHALAVLCFVPALMGTDKALADGGTVQFSRQVGDMRFTVMTDPTPLRVGIADVSIMLQDARSGAVIHDGRATVIFSHAADPPLSMRGEATRAAATNKLLRAAQLDIPRPGKWQCEVEFVTSEATIRVQEVLNVAERPDRWRAAAPWLFAPLVPMGLYVVAEWLASRRKESRQARCRP